MIQEVLTSLYIVHVTIHGSNPCPKTDCSHYTYMMIIIYIYIIVSVISVIYSSIYGYNMMLILSL